MTTSRRIADLIAALRPEEKVALLMHESPAIPRLGIAAYDWWSECLHGVARAGVATVFPQAIALAATFDADLVAEVYEAVAAEALYKHRLSGRRERYWGLTFCTPERQHLPRPALGPRARDLWRGSVSDQRHGAGHHPRAARARSRSPARRRLRQALRRP